jgi:hypothetical protein
MGRFGRHGRLLPTEAEEAIFQHYDMTYQPGAGGEKPVGDLDYLCGDP